MAMTKRAAVLFLGSRGAGGGRMRGCRRHDRRPPPDRSPPPRRRRRPRPRPSPRMSGRGRSSPAGPKRWGVPPHGPGRRSSSPGRAAVDDAGWPTWPPTTPVSVPGTSSQRPRSHPGPARSGPGPVPRWWWPGGFASPDGLASDASPATDGAALGRRHRHLARHRPDADGTTRVRPHSGVDRHRGARLVIRHRPLPRRPGVMLCSPTTRRRTAGADCPRRGSCPTGCRHGLDGESAGGLG